MDTSKHNSMVSVNLGNPYGANANRTMTIGKSTFYDVAPDKEAIEKKKQQELSICNFIIEELRFRIDLYENKIQDAKIQLGLSKNANNNTVPPQLVLQRNFVKHFLITYKMYFEEQKLNIDMNNAIDAKFYNKISEVNFLFKQIHTIVDKISTEEQFFENIKNIQEALAAFRKQQSGGSNMKTKNNKYGNKKNKKTKSTRKLSKKIRK